MIRNAKQDYQAFLERKATIHVPTGLVDLPDLPSQLFDFQHDITAWALKRGRAAIFAGTGLGKSLMELAWGKAVSNATGKKVLMLTPLAVSAQMIREAEKFGIEAAHVSVEDGTIQGTNITNYQKLDHFDLMQYGGIILDESSILKHHDWHYRTRLIEEFQRIPFRLSATATPVPNDFMELGNHAEFLGIMSYTDMLATYFVHDGSETQKWRLRGYAEEAFWKWMCTWAVMFRNPRDLGYDGSAYDLPPLNQSQHTVGVEYAPCMEMGTLFPMAAQTLSERISARRESIDERVAKAAEITPKDRPFVWWCNLNTESEALVKAIPGAVELRGSDSEEKKERVPLDFIDRKIRVLISKPSILGFGMNFQHCADTGFVGLNDSFEQIYQAIRRFWRFGQTKPVNVHFIASELEGAVVANLKRKEMDAERMADAMIRHMADLSAAIIHGAKRDTMGYEPSIRMKLPSFIKGK